jgi:uncharacterized protein with PIN domain
LSAGIPEGNAAFDSSVLIELLEGTTAGAAILEAVTARSSIPHTSWVNIMESEYILCRKIGHENARKSVKALLDSGYFKIEENPAIHEIAARIKCERSISVVDCYTFAVAELTSSVPLFASEEAEIVREMKRKPFKVSPSFLPKLPSPDQDQPTASKSLKKVSPEDWTDAVRKSRDER